VLGLKYDDDGYRLTKIGVGVGVGVVIERWLVVESGWLHGLAVELVKSTDTTGMIKTCCEAVTGMPAPSFTSPPPPPPLCPNMSPLHKPATACNANAPNTIHLHAPPLPLNECAIIDGSAGQGVEW
jgi:hypothetical protein